MEPLAGLLGAAGFVLGIAADRLAVRWPEHDEEHPPGRAVDWRTAVVALVGALRFGGDALAVAIFGAWFVTLIIGLATDLDQRLLPDILTLPVIPVALVYAISGSNPLVGSEVWLAVAAALAIPAVLYLPSIPFGAGAFGLAGGERALACAIFSLLLAGVVLVVLLAARRIGRKTYVPFGPFFIIGALWAVLLRP